jgi:hypothetical protein
MKKGEIKKEILFTNDIFREVSKRISVQEPLVKEVFNDFMKDFKQHILETDDLFYGLTPLGVMSINKKDLDKNIRKLTNKHYKETDEIKKQKLKQYLENFKVREKRMRVEQEKFKVIYPDLISKVFLNKTRNAMFKPSKFEASYYTNKVKLKEAEQQQNNYAYNWYKKQGKPINH